jgi:hypothetical protein
MVIMSWYRQIKILYTICSNTFFFIIWATFLNGLVGGKSDYKLYLLTLFTSFSMVYILEKTKKLSLSAAVTIITSEIILFLIYGRTDLIINSIYICFIMFITRINEDQDVNYELYKYKAKQAITSLVVIGFIFTLTKLNTQQSILKFYIIFLISASILMREARNYYYRIKNNKSFIANIALTLGIIFISLDSVFNIILTFIKYLGSIFYKIADVVVDIIAFIIRKPLEIMINCLKNKFADNPDLVDKMNNTQDKLQNNKEIIWKVSNSKGWPTWFTSTLKVIILLMIMYFVYRLFSKYKRYKGRRSEDILEERIKLSKEKSQNDNFIKKAVKRILSLKDLKEQALNVYKKFELKTNEKGIFRSHMTAKQLENITKAYIENTEGINNLTDIYNEAKFSTHKVTKEQVEAMKESFHKVRKQLH